MRTKCLGQFQGQDVQTKCLGQCLGAGCAG